MEALAIVFAGFAGIVAVVVIASLMRGWALSVLWGWFLVPLGLPGLNIPTAIGISLVVSFLTHQTHDDDKERTFSERMFRLFGAAILTPLLGVFIGWVVKHFL